MTIEGDDLIRRVADLAMEAEEQGRPVLSSALLHIVRASSLPPSIGRRVVNTCVMVLEVATEALQGRQAT